VSRIAACAPQGLSIEYQDEGPRGGPVILMIMGLGMQLTAWPRPLIDGLHAHGFRTLRFDNRDAGLSDRIVDRARLDIRAEAMRSMIGLNARSPYTLHDMAGDALGLMNALMIDRAHVVGVSMGGMIGQVLAAESGKRVRSLTSIMSSSGAPRTLAAVSRPAAIGTSGSTSPCMTSVGTLIRLSRGRRSALAITASICRIVPPGLCARCSSARRRSRRTAGGGCIPGLPISRQMCSM